MEEGLSRHEPPPVKNDRPAVWDLVIDDMRTRDHVGAQRYGTRLQSCNGRNARTDHYQELLDAVVYARQDLEEQRILRGLLLEVRNAISAGESLIAHNKIEEALRLVPESR